MTHHPCKDTCSGWQQGFEEGAGQLAQVTRERDETGASHNKIQLRCMQIDEQLSAARAHNAVLTVALERIEKWPFIDGKPVFPIESINLIAEDALSQTDDAALAAVREAQRHLRNADCDCAGEGVVICFPCAAYDELRMMFGESK